MIITLKKAYHLCVQMYVQFTHQLCHSTANYWLHVSSQPHQKSTVLNNNKNNYCFNLVFQLSSATTDEQVKATLTCDDVLDVLESIGYSGIPQKETVAGIQPIIQ